jgi:hypothetical protein
MTDLAKAQRPITLLPELERLLSTRPSGVSAAIRHIVNDLRPCVRLTTTRTTGVPLRGTLVNRLLRRRPPDPVLAASASKFGGIPYAENAIELNGARFIGQINFAEVSRALSEQNFPKPDGMPESGLLAVDLPPGFETTARVRWYPDPRDANAVRPEGTKVVAKYEARMQFFGSWSLRGLEWFDAVPKDDGELWDYMNDLEVAGVDEDGHGGHKLLGHPNEALNEHYGLNPIPGRSNNIREYALLWRIDADNAARFSWGTNWLYVVIHADDLSRGALQNAFVTGANA